MSRKMSGAPGYCNDNRGAFFMFSKENEKEVEPWRNDMFSKRSNDIAYPRQIAMYLCRDIANMPFTKIGDAFGKRDHTTVMHACSKIEREIKENSNTKLIVESVKNIVLNGK